MQQARYKNLLLILLTLILASNYMDRVVLGLVLQDVKVDLQLSDTQLGVLTGIAFALFYSIMGIPIARWADRGNRVTIISITTGLWSAMVALCAAATSFIQLLLIRVGVAVGEAGCIPPAHSLIADHFSRAERPRAVACYKLGMPLAMTVGFFTAGWLNEFYGWRATFVIVSIPGLLLAMLARALLYEPRRVVAPPAVSSPIRILETKQSFKEVCLALWSNAAYRNLLMCHSIWAFFGYGIMQWTPAFFIRSHGLQTGELGMWLSLIVGIAGGVGVYVGGRLAARYAPGDERLQLRGCAVVVVFLPVISIFTYLAPSPLLAFVGMAVSSLSNAVQAPVLATIQTLVAPHMRAISIALVYLFSNLIGFGLGPLMTGALSDVLRPWLGDESLRNAIVLMCPGYLWSAWHLWRASRTVDRDLAAAWEETSTEDIRPIAMRPAVAE